MGSNPTPGYLLDKLERNCSMARDKLLAFLAGLSLTDEQRQLANDLVDAIIKEVCAKSFLAHTTPSNN